jgi:hypothetical protein
VWHSDPSVAANQEIGNTNDNTMPDAQHNCAIEGTGGPLTVSKPALYPNERPDTRAKRLRG